MIRCMSGRSSATAPGPRCSRRSALVILSITGATLLSACTDSGPDDAPGPSDSAEPTKGPAPSDVTDVPDADVLLATLASTREMLAACSAVAETSSRRLKRTCAVIEEQHDVLVRLIDAGGLDIDDGATATSASGDDAISTAKTDAVTSTGADENGGDDRSSDTSSSDTSSSDSDSDQTSSTSELSEAQASAAAKAQAAAEAEAEMLVATLLAEQSTGASIVDTLAAVSPTNLPTLMALHGQRAAAAEILGATVRWPVVEGPLGSGAITVLAGLRQAVYGFEVLVARSTEKERDAYNEALGPLREASRTVTELAGPAAPVAPLGYGLPSDVGSEDQRRQLAKDLLTALTQAVIAGSAARAGDEDAIAGTLRLMSLSVRLGTSLRVPTTPFPGLTVPAS